MFDLVLNIFLEVLQGGVKTSESVFLLKEIFRETLETNILSYGVKFDS